MGCPSTRESISLACDAAEAGADFAMVLPSGHYAGQLKANREALVQFFVDVARGSPIPVVLYNFRGLVRGLIWMKG